MVQMNITKKVPVDAKTMRIHLKVTDAFSATIADQDGTTIFEQEDGYVPGFMPGEHHGDYLILDIDIDTGQITNWVAPTAAQLQEWAARIEGQA